MISTVDPGARHGHKTSHRGFDGYKGHIAVDPDVEMITATAVTAGNAGGVEPVAALITDLTDPSTPADPADDTAAVYGKVAYGAARSSTGSPPQVSTPRPRSSHPSPDRTFTKDRFEVSLNAATVTYPNGNAIPIGPVRGHARHAGKADFGTACATCPDPAWQTDCRATRPKVEHKLAHLMRRRHGGRRARMRGRLRIAADFTLLAAAVNLARLATHGLNHTTHRLLQSQLLDCGLARGSLLMQNERLLRTRLAVPQKSILNVLGTLA